jgi:hypothetical protein
MTSPTTPSLPDALSSIRARFVSGNSVPVTSARITRDELEALEALLRERDELRKSVEGLLEHAVILSRDYLAVFNDWPDDKTLQGWETGRWRKALAAADFARATLAGPKP